MAIASVIVSDSAVHGLSMAFWRSWIAAPVIGIYALWEQNQRLTLKKFLLCAPAGLCFGLSIGLFFWSTQVTTLVNASLISSLQPIIIVALSYYFFHERITSVDVAFAAVAIGGAVVIVLAGSSDGTGKLSGDLLALIAIILGSFYFAFGKHTLKQLSVAEFMAGYFVWAGIVLTPMVLIVGAGIMPKTSRDIIQILAVAFIPGVGHVLINYSQGKAPLNMIGVLQLLIPVTATALAFLFLNATVSYFKAIGMIVVIVTIGASTYTRSKREEREKNISIE